MYSNHQTYINFLLLLTCNCKVPFCLLNYSKLENSLLWRLAPISLSTPVLFSASSTSLSFMKSGLRCHARWRGARWKRGGGEWRFLSSSSNDEAGAKLLISYSGPTRLCLCIAIRFLDSEEGILVSSLREGVTIPNEIGNERDFVCHPPPPLFKEMCLVDVFKSVFRVCVRCNAVMVIVVTEWIKCYRFTRREVWERLKDFAILQCRIKLLSSVLTHYILYKYINSNILNTYILFFKKILIYKFFVCVYSLIE